MLTFFTFRHDESTANCSGKFGFKATGCGEANLSLAGQVGFSAPSDVSPNQQFVMGRREVFWPASPPFPNPKKQSFSAVKNLPNAV
jgi:hypothetical protein